MIGLIKEKYVAVEHHLADVGRLCLLSEQLAHFKSNPGNQGNVLDRGLWRYTRHPNYFGDFCVWWGLYCVALSCGALWWSAIGPAIMTVFLIKFSGVGLLEKSLRRSKPGYEDYVTRTNAFFPWHPGS